jgi:tetratricopeptide (TPR) repeat protein
MNNRDNHKPKPSIQDDLELVRQSLLRSKFQTSDALQINSLERHKKEEETHKKEIAQSQVKLFENGYQALLEEITTHSTEGYYAKNPEIKPLPVNDFQVASEIMEESKSKINSGKDVSIDFPIDVQMVFYEISMNFYDESLYEKAISAFTFLTIINPDIQAFWVGLALSYERNLNISKAIESFETAIKSEPEDFSTFYGLLRCCEAAKDFSKIESLLEAAKANEATKEQAIEVLEYLKSKK